MIYDMHVHSNASDGTSTPRELVDEALSLGLSGIAITDHDTTDGLGVARDYINTNHLTLDFITGVEMNTEVEGNEVHILGYFIDYNNVRLNERLAEIREQRQLRAINMVKKLNDSGVKIGFADVVRQAGTDLIARPHVARALIEAGYCHDIQDAFAKYIGKGKPAYVSRYKFTPQEAVQLIKQAGGIPVLAHPGLIGNQDLLPGLLETGINGLEIYYPEHSDEQIEKYLQLSREHHLLVTGGSDYHGLNQSESRSRLGAAGINQEFMQEIKAFNARKGNNI